MKNNHTQLTRLAAISLVVVMCLSALPMLAPSASAAGDGTTYTWTAASDGHYGYQSNPTGERHDELITRILADGTQRHFDLGDLSQGGDPSYYPDIKSKYDSMGVPYHVVMGNHDHPATLMATFGMASGDYTIIDEDYAWIVLESRTMYGEIPITRLTYLEAQLELLEDKLVFILAHVPQKKLQPGVGVSDVDCLQFIRIVEEHSSHIGAVVFGHIHTPTVKEVNGVHYVNAGTFGSDDANTLDMYGYMLFSVSSNGGEHTISVSYRDVSTGDAVPGLSDTWTITTQPRRPTCVWDGEGSDNLASTAANWYRVVGGVVTNDVAPTSGDHVIFDATSTKNCTWDLDAADCTPYSITIATGYTGTVTQGDVDIGIGDGWLIQQDGVFVANAAKQIICAGDVFHTSGDFRNNLANLIMSGDGATLCVKWHHVLRKLTVTGDIVVLCGRGGELVNTGTISVADHADFEVFIDSVDTTYFWDGEGATELASEAANWYRVVEGVVTNDVAPTSGDHVIFDSTSTKNCTWDLDAADCTPYSITIATGYSGTVTQGDVDIGIGAGGIAVAEGATFTASASQKVYCDGSATFGPDAMTTNVLNIVLTGSGVFSSPTGSIRSFTLSGEYVAKSRISTTYKVPTAFVDITGHLDLGGNALTHHYWSQNSRITGTIEGGDVRIYQRSGSYEGGEISSDSTARLIFRLEQNQGNASTIRLNSDMRWGGEVQVLSLSSNDAPMTLDLNGHSLQANGITVGTRGAIVGDGTIINHGDLDASAGSLSFTGHYVQADGGTITLAPGQSFDRLEIASDDGRTATWSMTATGTVSPIVTGLESGVSYRWYLDGVKQGEVKAGKDGTIALSYVSTGLHTLEVKPSSMTIAMDGVAAAVGIIVVLAVLGGLFSMIGKAFGRLKF